MKRSLRLLLALAGLLLAGCVVTGCSHTKLQMPNGGKFSRTALGTDLGLQEASVSTNGTVTVKGLVSQQAQTAGAIAEGVARGLKPAP